MKRVPKMYVNIRKIPRMWEKAFRGDDGSQFSRKRPERPCGLNSKGLSLCFFELNYKQDTRANAQGRIIGNKHRKGLGTSRADVCWNGRRLCEPEFNCIECETSFIVTFVRVTRYGWAYWVTFVFVKVESSRTTHGGKHDYSRKNYKAFWKQDSIKPNSI